MYCVYLTFVIHPHQMFFESIDLSLVTDDPVVVHDVSAPRRVIAVTAARIDRKISFGVYEILQSTGVAVFVEFHNSEWLVIFG